MVKENLKNNADAIINTAEGLFFLEFKTRQFSPEVARKVAGISYRQLNDWDRKGD